MIAKNSKGFYQLEEFNLPGLTHGFSTRTFGNMSYKWGDKKEVDASRIEFTKASGINVNKVVQMDMNHGTHIEFVSANDGNDLLDISQALPNTDGIITSDRDVVLWVITGDCAPLLLYDPVKSVIGLAHCGWRGVIGKLPALMATGMSTHFKSSLEDIIVGIGPSIESCCYVEPRPAVQENLPEWEQFYKIEGDKIRLDINGFIVYQLTEVGVASKNIIHHRLCTKDNNDEFYCSQLETLGSEKPGRFATAIQLT